MVSIFMENIGKHSNPMDEIGTCHQPRLRQKSVVRGTFRRPHSKTCPALRLRVLMTGSRGPANSKLWSSKRVEGKKMQNCHSCDIKQHVNCQLSCHIRGLY